MTKKVSFGAKPSTAPRSGHIDDWVQDRKAADKETTKRLTIDVPLSLHKRIKSQCAMQNLVMADEIRSLLERRFPNTSEHEEPSRVAEPS